MIFGVLGFLLGQGLLKRFIEPWIEYRKVHGRIAAGLIRYAQVVSITTKTDDQGQKQLLSDARSFFREQSGELLAVAHSLPWPLRRWQWDRAIKASKELIGLSNSVGVETSEDFIECKSRLIGIIRIPDLT
jgi:hypothetical protein